MHPRIERVTLWSNGGWCSELFLFDNYDLQIAITIKNVHAVIWVQVFLSNSNNLQTVI